tara:strand:+ start:183 stop:1208 length:1026 start_codon:yes stop_codon:yes gene_type:complete
MRITELKTYLPKLISNGDPLVLVAGPGVGKTQFVLDTAKELGYETKLFHPAVSDPTDFKGQPFAYQTKDGDAKARHLPYEDLDSLINADKPTVAFFDDMGQATPATQAALMQPFEQREVSGHKISDHVVFMGATNRAEDKAGVASMIEPLKGRATLLELEPHIDDWVLWAYEQEWMPPEVIAYLRFQTTELNNFIPSRDMSNSPTPRNWARLAKKVSKGLDNTELLTGDVGAAAATAFIGFRKVMHELPDVDDVIKNPTTATVPSKKSANVMYALMGALSHRSRPGTIDGIVTYLDRVPAEFSVLCMQDCIAKNKKNSTFRNHKSVTKWCLEHQDVMGLFV